MLWKICHCATARYASFHFCSPVNTCKQKNSRNEKKSAVCSTQTHAHATAYAVIDSRHTHTHTRTAQKENWQLNCLKIETQAVVNCKIVIRVHVVRIQTATATYSKQIRAKRMPKQNRTVNFRVKVFSHSERNRVAFDIGIFISSFFGWKEESVQFAQNFFCFFGFGSRCVDFRIESFRCIVSIRTNAEIPKLIVTTFRSPHDVV